MISIGLTGHRPPRLGYETDILKDMHPQMWQHLCTLCVKCMVIQ